MVRDGASRDRRVFRYHERSTGDSLNTGVGASPPEVQKGNDIEKQDHAEGHDERDGPEPSEYKSSVAGAGWRRGNSNDVVKSPEYLCEEFDHGTSEFDLVNVSGVSEATQFKKKVLYTNLPI